MMRKIDDGVVPFLLATTFMFGALAFCGELDVPEGDPLVSLLNLITNFKALSPLAIAAVAVMTVVQGLNKFMANGMQKKAIVVVLSVGYAVIQKINMGVGWGDALAMVLLTAGGATAIYEWVVKPFLKKPV